MQWTREGGFSDGDHVEPWLPMGEARSRNVADQRDDPASFLTFCRDLIGVRRDREDLRSGPYERLGSPEGVWAWRRGSGTMVIVNHGDGPATLPTASGTVLIDTGRQRAGERVEGPLRLEPWEALILDEEANA